MKKLRLTLLIVLLIALAGVPFLSIEGGAGDSIHVTLYQGGPAGIVITETLSLHKGENEIVKEFSPSMIKNTLFVDPGEAELKRADFHSGKHSESSLLTNYLGGEITIVSQVGDQTRTVRGQLLSLVDGKPLIQLDDQETVLVKDPTEYHLSSRGLPNLNDLLELTLEADSQREVKLTYGYQLKDLTWEPKYTGFLNEEERTLELTGIAHITNDSREEFRSASLNLIAGSPNREEGGTAQFNLARTAAAKDLSTPEEVFEYYRYPIEPAVNILSGGKSQIPFIHRYAVTYEREYYYAPSSRQSVGIAMKMVNKEENGLGLPLAAGTIRLYDDKEERTFLGSDRLENIPVGEEVKLGLGSAFDVKGSRARKEHEKIGDGKWEDRVEVELTNRKEKRITVNAIENLSGSWDVLESSHPYEVLSSNRIQFTVDVDGESSTTIDYKVRYEY
ncbi:MAG: DUF4139 domain-containing protein [Candidatus Acetothermia bacterium]